MNARSLRIALCLAALACLVPGSRAPVGAYGYTCETTADCYFGLSCLSGRCGCTSGSYMCINDFTSCCTGTQTFGSSCTSTDVCANDLICYYSSTGITCQCRTGYALCDGKDNACCLTGSTATYGRSCTSSSQCSHNLVCRNGTCACDTGYSRCLGTSTTLCCDNEVDGVKPYSYGHSCRLLADCAEGMSCQYGKCDCDTLVYGYTLCPGSLNTCCAPSKLTPPVIAGIAAALLVVLCLAWYCGRRCFRGRSASPAPKRAVAVAPPRAAPAPPAPRVASPPPRVTSPPPRPRPSDDGGGGSLAGVLLRQTIVTPEGHRLTKESLITPAGTIVKHTVQADGHELTMISTE